MSYFENNYQKINYRIADPPDQGLYRAQLGAIHAISASDALGRNKQIITMPTGSGKTAVLMMTPFVLRANRVLVLTPSRIVADQIAEDFETLSTLKKIGVFAEELENPTVTKQQNRISATDTWSELEESDVIVTTPQCISPEYKDVVQGPPGFFDLILVDEAHHSPARTWNAVLEAFPNAKHILFTATPFRRDKKEIKGHFSYSYPLSKAYDDGIYSEIGYIPIQSESENLEEIDVLIAQKTEEIYQRDRENGLNHYVMVRTGSRTRAEKIEELYQANTGLRLRKIFGTHSLHYLRNTITDLHEGSLDGIIAVAMFGEGFNMPNLKIAAIHSPHKSLEVTLQFIGRFSRVAGENTGPATFIAEVNDMEIEGQRLFNESAVWQKIVPDLSNARITEEVENREIIQSFNPKPGYEDVDLGDISLYSLTPRLHVKIFRTSEDIDIANDIDFPKDYEVLHVDESEELSARVWILANITKPKWSKSESLFNQQLQLVITYIDNERHLLFIASSEKMDSFYKNIAEQYTTTARGLPSNEIQRVFRNLDGINFFNVGIRNARPVNESYRIYTGSKAAEAIDPNDKLLFTRGHAYGTAFQNGTQINLGASSSSKVWSSTAGTLPSLIRWCRLLATKISEVGSVQTNTNLDNLSTPDVIEAIPTDIVAAQWGHEIYKETDLHHLHYEVDGTRVNKPLLDFEIELDNVTTDAINFRIVGEDCEIPLTFTLRKFYSCQERDSYRVISEDSDENIEDFLNGHYLLFYTSEHGVFYGNEIVHTSSEFPQFNATNLEVNDWNGTDITSEVYDTANGQSVQNKMRESLDNDTNEVVIFDHRKGEIADFISFAYEGDSAVIVSFYHCKKSADGQPGIRIEDFADICSQSEKTAYWVKPNQLKSRLAQRLRSGSSFVRGDRAALDQVFERLRTRQAKYKLYMIQPGLSKNRFVNVGEVRNDVKSSLATTNHILTKSAGFTDCKVICSE